MLSSLHEIVSDKNASASAAPAFFLKDVLLFHNNCIKIYITF